MTAVQRIAQRSAIIDAEMQKLALANLRYGIGALSFVPMILTVLSFSVADPGCVSRIPDLDFFHTGSRIHGLQGPGSGSADLNFYPKIVTKLCDPGCASRMSDPRSGFFSSSIPDILDPVVKKALDPGSSHEHD